MTKLQQRKIPKYQLSGKSSYTPFNVGEFFRGYTNEDIFSPKVPYKPFDTDINKMKAADYIDETPTDYSTYLDSDTDNEVAQKDLRAKTIIDPFVQEGGPDYETVKAAEDKYKDLLTREFKTLDTDATTGDKLGLLTGAIKPGIALGSALLNWQQLKKTRDAAKNITAPRVDAATMPTKVVEDLPPEIINLYLKQIGGLKTKKTSDATANILGERISNLDKMGVIDKLTAQRVENLFKQREEKYKTEAINAQEAVKARNEQSKYAADMYNKKAAIDAEYEGKKQDFINRWTEEALVKPMEKRVAYNLGKEAIEESDRWNRLQTQIVNAQNRLRYEPTNPTYKKALDALLTQQESMTRKAMPSYGESMSYLFSKKQTT